MKNTDYEKEDFCKIQNTEMAKEKTPVSKPDQNVDKERSIEDGVKNCVASVSVTDNNMIRDIQERKSGCSKIGNLSSGEKPEPRFQEGSRKKDQTQSKTSWRSQSFTEHGFHRKRPQLSVSDLPRKPSHLTRSPSGGFGFQRKGLSTHSSSSSHSSGEARFSISSYRPRLHSDSFPEQGCLLPRGLKDQHAAHRCGWSESDSGSGVSPAEGQTSPGFHDEGAVVPSSVCTFDLSKKSDKVSKMQKRKESKKICSV
ncbi:uncharacterized protein LOC111088147 isoform X2 [Limulus polyphemus]|uniref:Uncharacterized protein LOC111088147 isoform X2 n=1 Tax=Limulus polyphemus TaxID=6850 RepID=A0ABM1TAW1_LIMPO|nr:uncharacterized protein LOC111088147 isoform X2 [Limulus polyphemus]